MQWNFPARTCAILFLALSSFSLTGPALVRAEEAPATDGLERAASQVSTRGPSSPPRAEAPAEPTLMWGNEKWKVATPTLPWKDGPVAPVTPPISQGIMTWDQFWAGCAVPREPCMGQQSTQSLARPQISSLGEDSWRSRHPVEW